MKGFTMGNKYEIWVDRQEVMDESDFENPQFTVVAVDTRSACVQAMEHIQMHYDACDLMVSWYETGVRKWAVVEMVKQDWVVHQFDEMSFSDILKRMDE